MTNAPRLSVIEMAQLWLNSTSFGIAGKEQREAHQAAIDAALTPSTIPEPSDAEVEWAWRCFYCDEVFHDETTASQHFGRRNSATERMPACAIDTEYVRQLEAKHEDAMNRVTASAWVNGTEQDKAALEAAISRLFPNYRPSNATAVRHVIDSFELWKCGDDTDGYQTSADHLAEILSRHTPSTKYYFNGQGKLEVTIEWATDHLHKEGSAFLEAVEALCDWMNGNDLSADHADQKPDDYKRLSDAMVSFRAALIASRQPALAAKSTGGER